MSTAKNKNKRRSSKARFPELERKLNIAQHSLDWLEASFRAVQTRRVITKGRATKYIEWGEYCRSLVARISEFLDDQEQLYSGWLESRGHNGVPRQKIERLGDITITTRTM